MLGLKEILHHLITLTSFFLHNEMLLRKPHFLQLRLEVMVRMETSAMVRLRYEELLFYAACVCNSWCVFLCVCVCLEGRVSRKGGGGAGVGMRQGCRRQLSRAMLRWCRPFCPSRGRVGEGWGNNSRRFLELWTYSKLLLKSLFYNSLNNSDTLLDCVFEPVYWIVDNVTRWFGVVSWPLFTFSSSPPALSPHHQSFPLTSRCLSVLSSSSQRL